MSKYLENISACIFGEIRVAKLSVSRAYLPIFKTLSLRVWSLSFFFCGQRSLYGRRKQNLFLSESESFRFLFLTDYWHWCAGNGIGRKICSLKEVGEITDFTDNIQTVGENFSTGTDSPDTHPYFNPQLLIQAMGKKYLNFLCDATACKS